VAQDLQQLISVHVVNNKMFHIVGSCPQTKQEDNLQPIHLAVDDALEWPTANGSQIHTSFIHKLLGC